jgi:hypothetical protein
MKVGSVHDVMFLEVPGEFSATMTSNYGGERCGRKREIWEQDELVASSVNLQKEKKNRAVYPVTLVRPSLLKPDVDSRVLCRR